ncbi:hypothetical protein [Cesiribacter sp. SM1]|uniref:hypothetical protein n=1 Tax=Cesiribacter sp. SM1 TaxID=2861196 RepID=UPI001CD54E56|nr:hypothetical protein [Cesiribacter sp. SM1]
MRAQLHYQELAGQLGGAFRATATAFLDFPLEIRKIIYTTRRPGTNIIENLKGKIHKFTAAAAAKNKLSYPTDEAVMKSVFLAVQKATKKWTIPIQN